MLKLFRPIAYFEALALIKPADLQALGYRAFAGLGKPFGGCFLCQSAQAFAGWLSTRYPANGRAAGSHLNVRGSVADGHFRGQFGWFGFGFAAANFSGAGISLDICKPAY